MHASRSNTLDRAGSSLIWKSGHAWPLSLAYSHGARVPAIGVRQPQQKRLKPAVHIVVL